MSLIRGSRGIVYFVHQFEPTFKEASLLDDPKLLPAVTALNRTITKLAPVLNSPSVDDAVIIESAEGETVETPLELMCKRHDGSLYVFVANVTSQQAAATLRFLNPLSSAAQAETIEAGDKVSLTDTGYRVELAGYGVGLYRITGESPPASQSTTTDANTPRG